VGNNDHLAAETGLSKQAYEFRIHRLRIEILLRLVDEQWT